MTKKVLERSGIDFLEIDLRDNPSKSAEFVAQGLTQAPIVTTDIKTWSGFRLDKIQSLVNYIRMSERSA
jgi:glutaredoxin